MFEWVVLFVICNVNWVVSFVICNVNRAVLFVISDGNDFLYEQKQHKQCLYIQHQYEGYIFPITDCTLRLKSAHMT